MQLALSMSVASTSVSTGLEKARVHLRNGTKRAIIVATSADGPVFAMVLYHEKLGNSLKIVSNAS